MIKVINQLGLAGPGLGYFIMDLYGLGPGWARAGLWVHGPGLGWARIW